MKLKLFSKLVKKLLILLPMHNMVHPNMLFYAKKVLARWHFPLGK